MNECTVYGRVGSRAIDGTTNTIVWVLVRVWRRTGLKGCERLQEWHCSEWGIYA